MKLISWNMNQRAANWAVLADLMREHDAVAAMVQEAVRPQSFPEGLQILGDPSLGDDPWRLTIPIAPRRKFASAIVVRGGISVERWMPTSLGQAVYGVPVISHPGQWVAVGLGEQSHRMWLVSLYGVWETMPDTREIFAEATLHRALSDLACLFLAKSTARLVLAGDLNIWRGYGHKKWEPGYRAVFDRLAAYGLDLAGPHRSTGAPLQGCPCGAGSACSHVRTYRYNRRPDSTPYQLDFVFTRGVQVAQCEALDQERHWTNSDHCPILVEIGRA
jgi:hypothetical protein